MTSRIKLLPVFIFLFLINIFSQNKIERKDIEVHFKGDAQIEVGNHFVGAEFHHSFPAPQRISFYYPAANSIDLSADYWKRDSTFIMTMGLTEGEDDLEWLHAKPFEFELTPYSVSFKRIEKTREIKISYNFCNDKPVMVLSIEIKNLTDSIKTYTLFTDLAASLKTSHTYNHKTDASSEYDDTTSTTYFNYDELETKYAQIFVSNIGAIPVFKDDYTNTKNLNRKNWWRDGDDRIESDSVSSENIEIPAAGFIYQEAVKRNESLKIVQLIGSSTKNEMKELVNQLRANYKDEINAYENFVLSEVNKNLFLTGDKVLDKTIIWARAVLAVNQHYIDGSIQPMPCPAEYNFYFTHDVLLTDLAAVNFDLARVKNNLQFIIDHADKNKIIPHAYYWKDSTFKTEYATPDNWNHFWFTILSASYLKHSSDTSFANQLYPFIQKSIEQTLQNEKDGLIWAYRPDWWDIGHNFGPRAYMTILSIKSLKDFIEISKALNKKIDFSFYEKLADTMQKTLNEKLWSEDQKYLINFYEDGSIDKHYYMGSLLAVYFNLLDDERSKELIQTASEKLLDEKLGIYTLFPMDFHLLIDKLKFAGNEAGEPFKYANGGIWMHGNAWYALALIKTGQKEKALEFIKRTMTLNGIINSPNGQPAMYEYRNSNYNKPNEYGKIDKPQFMWAAGWYLYCIYELFGK